MVVASVLMSMGMMISIPPIIIALSLKDHIFRFGRRLVPDIREPVEVLRDMKILVWGAKDIRIGYWRNKGENGLNATI